MKTVVWTDLFQALVMITGILHFNRVLQVSFIFNVLQGERIPDQYLLEKYFYVAFSGLVSIIVRGSNLAGGMSRYFAIFQWTRG